MTGSRRHRSGLSAEYQTIRHYESLGATLLEHRLRTPPGEIDLIFLQQGRLVFVEVKARKHALHQSPISPRQWQRLGLAAQSYILDYQSSKGEIPECRFDAALIGPDGRLEIIENAQTFEAILPSGS